MPVAAGALGRSLRRVLASRWPLALVPTPQVGSQRWQPGQMVSSYWGTRQGEAAAARRGYRLCTCPALVNRPHKRQDHQPEPIPPSTTAPTAAAAPHAQRAVDLVAGRGDERWFPPIMARGVLHVAAWRQRWPPSPCWALLCYGTARSVHPFVALALPPEISPRAFQLPEMFCFPRHELSSTLSLEERQTNQRTTSGNHPCRPP